MSHELEPIGTIVRCYEGSNDPASATWLAVVIPTDRVERWWGETTDLFSATMAIEQPPGSALQTITEFQGWIIGSPDGHEHWLYDVVDDSEVSPDLLGVAGRVLLDEQFVPWKELSHEG